MKVYIGWIPGREDDYSISDNIDSLKDSEYTHYIEVEIPKLTIPDWGIIKVASLKVPPVKKTAKKTNKK